MMQSRLVHWICKAAWVITALSAIHVGLKSLNIFNLYHTAYFLTNPQAKVYLGYVIGISGVISLLGLFKKVYACATGTCECCTCGK